MRFNNLILLLLPDWTGLSNMHVDQGSSIHNEGRRISFVNSRLRNCAWIKDTKSTSYFSKFNEVRYSRWTIIVFVTENSLKFSHLSCFLYFNVQNEKRVMFFIRSEIFCIFLHLIENFFSLISGKLFFRDSVMTDIILNTKMFSKNFTNVLIYIHLHSITWQISHILL